MPRCVSLTGSMRNSIQLFGAVLMSGYGTAGQLPPNDAFWSLTITDVVGYMVSDPINRSSFDDRSNLAKTADGSIDI